MSQIIAVTAVTTGGHGQLQTFSAGNTSPNRLPPRLPGAGRCRLPGAAVLICELGLEWLR